MRRRRLRRSSKRTTTCDIENPGGQGTGVFLQYPASSSAKAGDPVSQRPWFEPRSCGSLDAPPAPVIGRRFTPTRWRGRTTKGPLLRRRSEIERRQVDLRHLDLDLVEVDIDRLVEQAGDRDGKGDHENDHDGLQPDPGHRAPIDVGAFHFLWSYAAQVEQCK